MPKLRDMRFCIVRNSWIIAQIMNIAVVMDAPVSVRVWPVGFAQTFLAYS